MQMIIIISMNNLNEWMNRRKWKIKNFQGLFHFLGGGGGGCHWVCFFFAFFLVRLFLPILANIFFPVARKQKQIDHLTLICGDKKKN